MTTPHRPLRSMAMTGLQRMHPLLGIALLALCATAADASQPVFGAYARASASAYGARAEPTPADSPVGLTSAPGEGQGAASASRVSGTTRGVGSAALQVPERPAGNGVALGRYLVETTGCNDCHTAGYAASAGKVPESDWLQGDSLGWRGGWGTSYPTNLRLQFSQLTEAQWLRHARTMQPRPPMPWFSLRAMSDTDLRAIYRYVRAAGPAGKPAPAALPPGATPAGPFIQFPQ